MKSVFRHPIVTSLLGWIIWLYMAMCNRTIRWQVEGDEEALKTWLAHPNIIVAAWHSTILLLPSGWNRIIQKWPQQKTRSAMLISLSKDGEAVAKAIKHLGLEAVRGSSTHKKKKRDKGGMRALAEALKILKTGGGICITPDGPRGPAEIVQNGPIIMAQRSQAPILPYAIVSSPRKRLGTWDGFRIPYPFTRGALVFGQPVIPEPGLDRETLRQQLEINLKRAMTRAETLAQKKTAHRSGQVSKKDVE
ncbi:MAG: lysophospholipid acyltransferase family protein [Henriciella sp.]|nr:lysophospholipid acyltransferase family protein [Henriciella sp.]